MLSTPEKIVFVLVILATAALFLAPLIARYRIVRAGRPENRFDRMAGAGPPRPRQDPVPALHAEERAAVHRPDARLHFLRRADVRHHDRQPHPGGILPGFFPLRHGRPSAWLFSLLVDVFAVLVLVGVAYFIVRRFILRPNAYATTPGDSAVIYIGPDPGDAQLPVFRGVRHRPSSRRRPAVLSRARPGPRRRGVRA